MIIMNTVITTIIMIIVIIIIITAVVTKANILIVLTAKVQRNIEWLVVNFHIFMFCVGFFFITNDFCDLIWNERNDLSLFYCLNYKIKKKKRNFVLNFLFHQTFQFFLILHFCFVQNPSSQCHFQFVFISSKDIFPFSHFISKQTKPINEEE